MPTCAPESIHDVAEQVRAHRRDGHEVTLVRLIETRGFSSRERDHIVVLTSGAAPLGSLLSGALDEQLQAAADSSPGTRAVLELSVSDASATAAGLSCGGVARVLRQPASDIAEAGWVALSAGEPLCLVTELQPQIGGTEVFTAATIDSAPERFGADARRLFNRGTTQTTVLGDEGARYAVTTLWPVPALVVVGGGLIAAALTDVARLLGWSTQVTDEVGAAATLTHSDAVVVLSHDRAVDGPALQVALSSAAGYVGGLGSARTQSERAHWLTERGVPAESIARVHGPAGLDIGANTPVEIAIAIIAEILAVRSSAGGGSLQGRLGPIRAS